MIASQITKIIGAGAAVYLIALFANVRSATFDSSLALVVLSPLLMLVCVSGPITGAIAFKKNRRAGIVDHG